MLIVKTPTKRGINLEISWFCEDKELIRKKRLFSIHKQTTISETIPGLQRVHFPTKHIDLDQDPAIILKSFDKNTVYEVKRAERESVTFRLLDNIPEFVHFFNDFARAKKIRTITEKEMQAYGRHVIMTACCLGDDHLAMHSYIVDRESGKARLQYSASSYLGVENNERRAIIGRANRYLHFKDIEYFSNQGFKIYDLGGYALDTKDKAMMGVNSFKDSFGGSLVKNEYDYYPIWLYWLIKLKSLIR